MLNQGIKTILVLLMLTYVFFVHTDYTDADIFAERVVAANRITAISLDFFVKSSLNNQISNRLFHSSGIGPGGFDLGALRLMTNNEKKFNYRLKVEKLNGDDYLCNNLNLKIFDRNFFALYNGPLLSTAINSRLVKDDLTDYIFFISLDNSDPALMNKICEFNFNFRTYNKNQTEDKGIFAERLINNLISSGSW
ncbi:MAG: hypothetical protein EOM88_04200 [Clostridia bacterium]|nr:hypothetical protein [Clostridia bacterium]